MWLSILCGSRAKYYIVRTSSSDAAAVTPATKTGCGLTPDSRRHMSSSLQLGIAPPSPLSSSISPAPQPIISAEYAYIQPITSPKTLSGEPLAHAPDMVADSPLPGCHRTRLGHQALSTSYRIRMSTEIAMRRGGKTNDLLVNCQCLFTLYNELARQMV